MPTHRRSRRLLLPLVVTAATALTTATARESSSPPVAQTVKPDAQRAAHMGVHFGQVMTVHEAVIRGDLAAMRAPATWLAEHDAPMTLPAGTAPFVSDMRRAARRTADASTMLEAALGTADMLRTCGDCHRVSGTMPSAPLASGVDVGGVVGHMLEHQRAADQMLQGLVIPSSTSWRSGAEGFRVAPLRRDKLPDDPMLTPQLIASEKRIHELAEQASKVEASGARAVFYGQIIASCADCHAVHRKVWGPSRR